MDHRETEACFGFYTEAFDEPYPFDSYDQVMQPGHNWGALETAGCVTFREALNQVTASAHYDYSVENGTVHFKNAASKKAAAKKK